MSERSSFYLRVIKRQHSATTVALKRNVTIIMTGTVVLWFDHRLVQVWSNHLSLFLTDIICIWWSINMEFSLVNKITSPNGCSMPSIECD